MAKVGSTDDDVGLLSATSITADGATTGYTVPAGRLLELALSVPSGVTGTLECSYDGGTNYFTLTPTSLSVVDATSGAAAVTMQYFTEEHGIKLRARGAGTWGGGTMTFRISGAPKR
jgi:hypothetical protein